MPWRIGRSLENIGRALGSAAGEGPDSFDTGPVSPTLDVAQGGIVFERFQYTEQQIVAASAANTDIVVPTNGNGAIVQCSIGNGSLATARQISWQLQEPLGGARRLSLWENSAFDLNQREDWSHIGNGALYWYVPPGWRLQITMPVRPAGAEFCTPRVCFLEVPAGFKPW